MKYFVNDKIVDSRDAHVSCDDRGLLLGDGLLETCRTQGTAVEFFDEHVARLKQSADYLHIPMPMDRRTLGHTIKQLLIANGLDHTNAITRITLTRGVTERGIHLPKDTHASLFIKTTPLPVFPNSQSTWIIDSIRRNEHSPTTALKTLNYLDNILAKEQAREKGADDAILLNTQGNVAESSAANLFVVHKHQLYTPSTGEGILPGIMRAQVIKKAKLLGIPVFSQSLAPEFLLDADEIFLTNSVMHMMPITKINNQTINQSKIGKITTILMGS